MDVVLVPKLKRQEIFIYFYVTSLKKRISLLGELDVDVVVVSDTIVIVSDVAVLVSEVIVLVSDAVVLVSDAVVLVLEVVVLVSDAVVVATTKMNFLL